MNSRKSSASSTSSSHGNSKLKPIQPSTSSSSQKAALSSNSLSSIGKNHEISNKKSYLENFTEEDIQKDKVRQRYEMLMSKLENLTIEQITSKASTSTNGVSESPLSATSSKKVLPKIAKKNENTASTLSAINEAKGSQSSSSSNQQAKSNVDKTSPEPVQSLSKGAGVASSSDDESDNDAPINPIKAPNELLEEFLVYVMGKKWKDAHKLCQFILMYEPGNRTAKEFMPLIESKLNSSESGDEDEEDGDEEASEEETSSDESTSDSNSNSEESDESSDDKDKGENPGGKDQKPKEDYDDDDDVETPSSARLSKKKQAKEPFKFDLKKK